MKTLAALTVSFLVLVPVVCRADSSNTLGGALIGGVAGAIIGHNTGDSRADTWRGAAIGSVAGAVIGSAVDDSGRGHSSRGHSYGRGHSYSRTHVSFGYNPWYSYPYDRGYYGAYRAPVYYGGYGSYGYNSYRGRPSYATSGMLWGGLIGGVVGNNSHGHHAWRGAAIGAGAGLLLGSVADENQRYYQDQSVLEDARRAAEIRAAAEQTQQSTSPQNVTIINNYYGGSSTPMTSANSMFGR